MAGPDLTGLKVLVIGATGFIGARAAACLVEAGAEVSALARTPRRLGPGIRAIRGTLSGDADLTPACAGQDVIINFAHDFKADEATNMAAFEALLTGAKTAGVRRIIHASSIVVYDGWPGEDLTEDSPVTPGGNAYRATKIAQEARLAAFSAQNACPAIILQPTIAYGADGWIWTDGPVERLLAGPVILPDPPGRAHAVHVDDVAAATVAAAGSAAPGCQRVILNGPDGPDWAGFYRAYAEVLGRGEIRLEDPQALSARLPPQREETGPPSGPRLIEKLGAAARRIIGRGPVDRARILVGQLRRLRGPVPQYPDAYALALYQTRGICRSVTAQDVLGMTPGTGWAEGIEKTRAYLTGKYGRGR